MKSKQSITNIQQVTYIAVKIEKKQRPEIPLYGQIFLNIYTSIIAF